MWTWLFICSAGLMIYSYLVYPTIMGWLARGKDNSKPSGDHWPHVSIITAVYNEENVLEEKMAGILDLNYPQDRLHIYFGSDNSNDRSNEMLQKFARMHSYVTFIAFEERQGKIGVINKLGKLALEEHGKKEDHVLFYNDANVMLTSDIMKKMMRHFSDQKIALVDANMKSRKTKKEGISLAEKAYISSEVLLKHHEGRAWGMLQGAFGGCYGLRSTYHTIVPNGFLVDDFFISFSAMVSGGLAINDLEAHCFESASHDIWQEFRRKSRISAGNFQNLKYFLLRFKEVPLKLWFCFISHKVLRWCGPLLLIMMTLASVFMYRNDPSYIDTLILVGLISVFVIVPLIDVVLLRFKINIGVFRKVRYFLLMNIALFKGFIRYAKGIRKSFWDPPARV